MKYFFHKIFFFLFLFSFYNSSFSQCTANAGKDTIICLGLNGMDTVYLGGTPSAQSGIPPYTYTWSCDYWMGGGTLHFTASDFLDDTSIANPRLVNSIGESDSLMFFLTVNDNAGNTCFDSVKIIFSSYVYGLTEYGLYIEEGDSVQFYGISSVGGGISPFSYTWFPGDGLSDIHDLSAWASPDSTTFYCLTVTDAVGCVSGCNPLYRVYVYPMGIENSNDDNKLEVFPNPTSDFITVNFNKREGDQGELKIINSSGHIFQQYFFSQDEVKIDMRKFPNEIYLISLYQNGILHGKNKIIIHY